MLSTHFVDQNS